MLTIPAAPLSAEACYKLMSGVVVPRPIAWITTCSPGGIINLAPFSCYTFLAPKPPLVGINIGRRAGELKDTSRNIHASGEFVVNIADSQMLDALHHSADEFGPEISEVNLLGLNHLSCETVAAPRLADVPVSLECRLHSIQEFGELRAEFIVGEVTVFHFREGVCVDGKIDTRLLDPVCRLAGINYATLGEIIAKPPVRRTPHSPS
jgi:flavin reductase (DIM6/NTAB) family NADH-FMN oxidoreductase RutF